jgi:hypothetical protein
VGQFAYDQWSLLQLRPVRKWLVEAAIANAVHEQLAAAEAARLAHEAREWGMPGQKTPSAEIMIGLELWRSFRKQAFAAVSGDSAAIDFVERELGAGKLTLGPETAGHLERTFRTQLLADRVVAAALGRCANTCRELERMASKRPERSELPAPNTNRSRVLPIWEFALSQVKKPEAEEAARAEQAAVPEAKAPAPPPDVTSTTADVPTVHAPHSASSEASPPKTQE